VHDLAHETDDFAGPAAGVCVIHHLAISCPLRSAGEGAASRSDIGYGALSEEFWLAAGARWASGHVASDGSVLTDRQP